VRAAVSRGHGLRLRTAARPALAAGPRAGVELLALPAAELREELERLAIDNPFLVVEPPSPPGPGSRSAAAALGAVPAPVSLACHLQDQIACMDLPEPVATLARALVGELDPRGLLPAADAALAEELGAPPQLVAEARAALQACGPSGVGARDLGDCIRLQLVDSGQPPERADAIRRELHALAEGRFASAARGLGCSEAEARALAARIARLAPEPAAAFAEAAPPPLVPELIVQRQDSGTLAVALLDDPGAGIAVDEALAARARQGSAGARAFTAARLAAARRLHAAAGFRSRTLLAVGRALVELQSAHFLGRARAPGPLSRGDVAARLGLHPSTVGRAIRGRALLFEGRVRPLSEYFPVALSEGAGGVSSAEVRERMREILSAETAGSVLSDAEIARHLREAGVDIARRTVAKYRGCLSIPSAAERRRRLARRDRLREATAAARPR